MRTEVSWRLMATPGRDVSQQQAKWMHLRLDINKIVYLADNISEYTIFTWLKDECIWRTISLGFVAKGTNEKSALEPFRHHTITRNNADLFSVTPFNEILFKIQSSSTSRTLVELWFPMTKDSSKSSQQDYEQFTWWPHQMETFSALLAICAGNSPITGEFPTQRPVTRSFDVFFDLRLNKRLSKRSWGWWFETPSCPSWHHCNEQWPCTVVTISRHASKAVILTFSFLGLRIEIQDSRFKCINSSKLHDFNMDWCTGIGIESLSHLFWVDFYVFSLFPPRPRPLPPPPQRLLFLTSKPFELNFRYWQRKYWPGEMYWVTFGRPWCKVTAVVRINKISNQQPHSCLLDRLIMARKISKLRVTGLCERNSPVTGEFPAQRASNAENVSI